ncbi:MAG: Ig-like domain-containing protein [Leptolyngbyaceae cyanobacterium]
MPTSSTCSILFIDAAVQDISTLTSNVKPGIQVHLLNSDHDGVEQITQILQTTASLPTTFQVHIVAHGSPGTLHLGNNELSLNTLDRYAQDLKSWFAPTLQLPNSSTPQLNLYACNVAAGDAGAEFITKLYHLTGAQIAASTHPVGNGDRGGSWYLNTTTARAPAQLPFEVSVTHMYQGILPLAINGITANYQTSSGITTYTTTEVNNGNADDTGDQDGQEDAAYIHNFQTGANNSRVISSFSADADGDGGTDKFNFIQLVDKVVLKRIDNNKVSDNIEVIWYEQESIDAASNILNLKPTQVSSMEEALLSTTINRGADNLFANKNNPNINNIERVDYLVTNGLSAPSANLADIGFLFLERGGNDPLDIAAITAIDNDGNPTAYGDIVTIGKNDWGDSTLDFTTAVLNDQGTGNELGLSSLVPSQEIGGMFVSYQDLGITDGTEFFGYSIFPGDLQTDLVGLTDAKGGTSGDTGKGGVDLVAGGGLFSRENISLIPPTANNDMAETPKGQAITFPITENDDDSDGNLDLTTVDLDPDTPGRQTTFTVTGEGTYEVDDDGNVTFTPEPTFTGTTTPINYTLKDDTGLQSDPATITVTVNAPGSPPIATNDTDTTPKDTPTTFSITGNDNDSDGDLDLTTVDLDPTTPGRQTTFTTLGQGTYTIDDEGNVTFTPENGFTGIATPINYTVNDDDGLVSDPATITVTVNDPPIAVNDTAATPKDTSTTFSITGNDNDSDGTLDLTTVDLDPSTPGRQTTFTTPGQGTYTVDDEGNVTFTPENGFTGIATPINYTVNDNEGLVSNEATITVTVNDPPTATNDTDTTPKDTPTTFSITGNDNDSDGDLDLTTVDLDPTTPGRQTTFTTPGQGTYTIDDEGNVTFTPENGFTGIATPINYTVNDDDGLVSNEATITVTVNDPPTATNDTDTTPKDTPTTFSITGNDNDSDGTLDLTTVDLDPSIPGRQTTFTTPGQGTYTVDDEGNVTFTPENGFTGIATPINYTVNDNEGLVSDPATITVTVNDPPIATNDTDTTPKDTPTTFSITGNDNDSDGDLDLTTVDLDPTTPGRQTTLPITGEGTYEIDNNGNVTFTPDSDFTGIATPIKYTVADDEGLVSNEATITVTVNDLPNEPPIATNDTATTPKDTPTTFSITDNDNDSDGTLDLTTVDLDPTTPGRQTTFTTPGQGTYTVDDAGNVTFTPENGFTGIATPINYTVNDNDGLVSEAGAIAVTVNVPPNDPPIATHDTATISKDNPVTFSITGNDNDSDGTLDLSTVDLDPNTPGRQTTFTVPGEGTYTIDNQGNLTFTPDFGFTGIATPISYTVNDNDGTSSNAATITVTVTDESESPPPSDTNSTSENIPPNDTNSTSENTPPNDTNSTSESLPPDPSNNTSESTPPSTTNDMATTSQGNSVTFSITNNDSDRDGTLDLTTVDLDPSTPGRQMTFTVPGEGSYTVDDKGTVTFTPELDFTGDATAIRYTVADNDGITSNPATITIAVTSGDRTFNFQGGSGGPDNLQGTDDGDILNGFSDLDVLDGGGGNDIINGGSQKDNLIGGLGDDILNGGTNDDRMRGNDGDDLLNGGSGNDHMFGHTGNDLLNGGRGNDHMKGGKGRDTLNGGDDNDKLWGQQKRDIIIGGDGNDKITGGLGKDVLTGGEGRDIFCYNTVKDFGDRIIDFEIIMDKFDLRRIKGISTMDDLNFIQKGDVALIQARVGNTFKTVAKLDDIDIHDLGKSNFKL